MPPMRDLLAGLLWEESGQDILEYALIFTFVALVVLASFRNLFVSVAQVANQIAMEFH